MDENEIKSTATLFANYKMPQASKRMSERGELLYYFADKLGWPVGRVGARLKGMQDLRTLYFIKSDCDQAASRGVPWGAAFHTSLRVR